MTATVPVLRLYNWGIIRASWGHPSLLGVRWKSLTLDFSKVKPNPNNTPKYRVDCKQIAIERYSEKTCFQLHLGYFTESGKTITLVFAIEPTVSTRPCHCAISEMQWVDCNRGVVM